MKLVLENFNGPSPSTAGCTGVTGDATGDTGGTAGGTGRIGGPPLAIMNYF